MKIGVIVQARMSSKRFPDKVLYNVNGKPMLQYLMESLQHCNNIDSVVVATSIEDSDTPVAEYCKDNNVYFFRGELLNVAGRFKEVIDKYGFDAFVRISGDSPLINPRIIEKGIDIFLSDNYDVVTNTLTRTYPKGQSVEILRSDVFMKAYKCMQNVEDLEHVTKYFYKNRNDFNIFNFESGNEYGGIQLSVDTQDDMYVFSKIISKMNKPHWVYTLENILEIYWEISGKSKTEGL